jgi:hypothetical protein
MLLRLGFLPGPYAKRGDVLGESVTEWRSVPDSYHKDMLHAMVRDANTLFVYWEISNRRKWLVSRHFRCDWSVMPKILRLYDTTELYFNGSNANDSIDIETTPEATNWYIHGVHGNATYIVDFGTRNINGQFIPLLRSNVVMTPRDQKAVFGEPIVAVEPEARVMPPQRISPQFLENFSAYSKENL